MDYEKKEFKQLDKTLVLIASENYPSQAILNASGSIFQVPYTEGHASKSSEIYKKSIDRVTGGARYYQGCEIVDEMEQDCIDKCLKLFNAEEEYYANVQPNSGASANMIVYNAMLNPGDTVLAPDVKSSGHISHSHPKSFIAKYHNVITYGVNEDGFLDYDEIERLAMECRPKLIICGASNYSRIIDFKRFKRIADKCAQPTCYLMADIAHISILCAHGQHPSPVGLADFITFTTHKCMASARGACIIYKKEYDKQIRLSTIPGLFGGPLQHQIYAKLVGFNQALTPEFKDYSDQIIKNTKVMCNAFNFYNIPIVTGGSDNHLLTVDLRNFTISGRKMAEELEKCGIICNCNTVPNDPRSFMETSGIRLGTPAITTRGLKEIDVEKLSLSMAAFIDPWRTDNTTELRVERAEELAKTVQYLTSKFPLSNIYKG